MKLNKIILNSVLKFEIFEVSRTLVGLLSKDVGLLSKDVRLLSKDIGLECYIIDRAKKLTALTFPIPNLVFIIIKSSATKI